MMASEMDRLADFHREMADLHQIYAEMIRETEERYGFVQAIRLGRGELPSLVLGLLSELEYQESGMRLKELTKILWDRGYRTNRGPAQGKEARNKLYQMVYLACAKMIDDKEAVNEEHCYQLTEDGRKKAEDAA